MYPMLSASPGADNSAATQLMEQLLHLERPSQQEMMNAMEAMGAFQAIVVLALGVAILLNGWKAFKLVAILNAAIIGGLLGTYLGGRLDGDNLSLIGGIAGGLVLAVLAWPAMRIAISVMGSIVGASLGYAGWYYSAMAMGREGLTEHAWAGALLGLVTLGLLAFVVFQFVVMAFTSFQGSIMAISGMIALLLKHPDVRDPIYNALMNNEFLPPLVVGAPALIGFVFQYAALDKKRKKKRKPSDSGGV